MPVAHEVIQLLREPSIRRINLSFGSCQIWGSGFERIATAIERAPENGGSGQNCIRVWGPTERQSAFRGTISSMVITGRLTRAAGQQALGSYHDSWAIEERGEYCHDRRAPFPHANILHVPSDSLSSPHLRALVLHECCHALQDWSFGGHDPESVQRRREGMPQTDSEGAAYVAQMMYLQMSGFEHLTDAFPDATRARTRRPSEDDPAYLFRRAWEAADRIYTTQGGYEVTEAEQERIGDGLVVLAPYAEARKHRVYFDGV